MRIFALKLDAVHKLHCTDARRFAKKMGKVLKLTIKLLIFVVAFCALIFALARLPLGPVTNVAKTAESEIMQIFDQNAVTKRAAQNLVEAESAALASAMGITEQKATELLSNIDIAGWSSTTLPASAVATKTLKGSAFDIDGSITLYNDKSYLTITANDKETTLSVPEDAQKAVSYLYFL